VPTNPDNIDCPEKAWRSRNKDKKKKRGKADVVGAGGYVGKII